MDMEELSDSFSLSLTTIRLCLIFFLLFFTYTPVEGQFQVIGSFQPVVAAPGDDVILPCHVEPPINVVGLTVEWSKPDLQPDPNDRLRRVEYVHLYRDTREVPDMKLSAYVRRTTLFTDGLRQGNISLKITNVTLADEGRYKCFLPKLRSQNQFSVVRLVVEQHFAKTWTTETPLQTVQSHLQTADPQEEADVKGDLSNRSRLVPVFCLLLILFVGVTIYLTQLTKCQKQELMKVFTICLAHRSC